MQGVLVARWFVLILAGSLVVGSLAFPSHPAATPADAPMDFWEAAGRGLVTVVMENENINIEGHNLTQAAGIRVTNNADVAVNISEETVLMSPHPSQSPPPDPANTTPDASLTPGIVPAHGSVLYSVGRYVLAGYLSGPIWWDLEEMETWNAGVAFRVGGETLPFGLRELVEHPYYNGPGNNTQTAIFAYLRSYPTVVVGKLPLWTSTNGSAGQTVRVRIDATNLAVWSEDDTFSANVNLTNGIVEDTVPAGWSVEEGSFSIPRPWVVNNTDGSTTLRWNDSIGGADVPYTDHNYSQPTDYSTATHFYTLVAPALGAGTADLPRAVSDMTRTGTPDAHSAGVGIAGTQPPTAAAGGPYAGNEDDVIVLNASKSTDSEGDPLRFRWSYTDNGTWDTGWSSDPTARVRYTDEFTGQARVEVSDGFSTADAVASVTIANVPPAILSLTASSVTSADFRLIVAGEKYHDVTLHLTANGTDLADLRVVRQPGDPANQSAATGMLSLNASQPVVVTVLYTPSDDPVNGQPNGASPAWVVITLSNGTSFQMFHNFNVKHESTWTWNLGDLRGSLGVPGVTLRAHLYDPGADTLTATWDFGDGTSLTQVFPNGPSGDNPEAVMGGAAPVDLIAAVSHEFRGGSSFTVTLTVTDADGASTTATLVVTTS